MRLPSEFDSKGERLLRLVGWRRHDTANSSTAAGTTESVRLYMKISVRVTKLA